jgi:hypothetical protein
VKVHHVAFCLVLVHRGIRDHSAAYTEKFSIKNESVEINHVVRFCMVHLGIRYGSVAFTENIGI